MPSLLATTLLSILLLAGCAAPSTPPPTLTDPPVPCAQQPLQAMSLYLAAGNILANASGPAGLAPANQGHDAFTGNLHAWLSAPVPSPIHLEGSMRVALTLQSDGVNPFGTGTQGNEAYIQLGSDRAFVPGGIAVPANRVSVVGSMQQFDMSFDLPNGGFNLETGDRFSLLITSLVEGADGPGLQVEYGGENPSAVVFQGQCLEPREWLVKRNLAFPVILPGNQGSFTHTVPPQEGVNRLTTPFDLEEGTARLTIRLRQLGGRISDMDMFLLDATGKIVYEAASPFANETMVLWPENLAAAFPPGHYQVRIDAYGGANYSGRLTVLMEEAEPPAE